MLIALPNPKDFRSRKGALFCARSQYDVLTVGMLQKQREKWNTEEGIIPTGVTHAGEGMSQLIYSQRGAQAAGTVVDCQLWFCRAASGRMKGGEIAPAAAGATSVRGEGDLPAGACRPFSGDSGTCTSFAIAPVCQCLVGALEAECQLWLPHLTSLGLYNCRGVGPLEGIAEQQLGLSLSCPGLNLLGRSRLSLIWESKGDRLLQDRGSSEEKAETMAVSSTVLSSKCEALCHTYRRDTVDKTRSFLQDVGGLSKSQSRVSAMSFGGLFSGEHSY